MRINTSAARNKKKEGIESGQIGRHESTLNMQELPQPPARDEPWWQAARLPPDREAGRERKMNWTRGGAGV